MVIIDELKNKEFYNTLNHFLELGEYQGSQKDEKAQLFRFTTGHQLRPYDDGTKVKFNIIEQVNKMLTMKKIIAEFDKSSNDIKFLEFNKKNGQYRKTTRNEVYLRTFFLI